MYRNSIRRIMRSDKNLTHLHVDDHTEVFMSGDKVAYCIKWFYEDHKCGMYMTDTTGVTTRCQGSVEVYSWLRAHNI